MRVEANVEGALRKKGSEQKPLGSRSGWLRQNAGSLSGLKMRAWLLGLFCLVFNAKFVHPNTTKKVTFESSMREGDVADIKGILSTRAAPFLAEVFGPKEEPVIKVYIQGVRRQMLIIDRNGRDTYERSKSIRRGAKFKLWLRRLQDSMEIRLVNSDFITVKLMNVSAPFTVSGVKLRGTYDVARVTPARWQQYSCMTENTACGTRSHTASVPRSLCSQIRSKYGKKIVNGSPAKAGDHPWQVSIRKFSYETNTFQHICGGVLIDACWVLSAAHCVPQASDVGSYRVRVGDYYNKDDKDKYFETFEDMQEVDVKKIYPHPGYYTEPSTRNDIALLRLLNKRDGTCVAFGNFVQPVCLPHSVTQFTASHECVITGWGATEAGQSRDEFPPCLQEAVVNLITEETCKQNYPDVPVFPGSTQTSPKILDTMQCAESEDGANTDACQGDSGGPLICTSIPGRITVWGITSWGAGCGTNYGVYTKVYKFLNWMESTMIKSCKFDPFA